MTIAREEIFGPVLSILPYATEEEAIALANDSEYGLSGFVWSGSPKRALAVASKLRTGMVHINGAPADFTAPFGGYKGSGNGRELGVAGLEEFLETKSVMGVSAPEGGKAQ
jgi:acyl-CoA reductase-like NAD-dependent aldehyde dehydrogenase